MLTNHVWSETSEAWMPSQFLEHSSTSTPVQADKYDIDIKCFCVPVIHPVIGKNTNYLLT